jgi:polar amino acid transport system substrate-binding protein
MIFVSIQPKRIVALLISALLLTACAFASLAEAPFATLTPGKLTIATGEPAWEPWVLNDDPQSGEGFEAALAYAIASKLGFEASDVEWVRTSFEEAIQPGPKSFDFNLQQYSITEERAQVVDFSTAYYKEPRVVVTLKSNPYASADSVAALQDALFGAAMGDIALEYTREAIAPKQEIAVFNDLVAVLQAINAGQIDCAVVGVAEGDYIVSSDQLDGGVILGVIPGSESVTGGLGLLLEKDSPLTAAVSQAIDELTADGTLAALVDQYLKQYAYPELK